MLSLLEARGASIAARAQAEAIERIAQAVRDQVPGVAVSATPEGVELRARGLSRRLASDATLRWIGSLWR